MIHHVEGEREGIIECACGKCENYIDFMDYRNGVVDLNMYRVDGNTVGFAGIVLDVNSLTTLMELCQSALEAMAKQEVSL